MYSSQLQGVTALLERWREEAERLTVRYSASTLAALTTTHISELESAFNVDMNETMGLREAATYGGYTADHLGRMISNGTLLNVGRKHAPKVRRGDVPIKTLPLRNESSGNTHSPRKRIVLAARTG